MAICIFGNLGNVKGKQNAKYTLNSESTHTVIGGYCTFPNFKYISLAVQLRLLTTEIKRHTHLSAMAVATTVTVSSLCASPLRSPRTVPNFVFQFAPKFSSFKLGFESLQLRTTLPATKLVVRAARTESKGVSLGFRAPNFEIPEPLTGKVWKLEDFESHPALLVMFICNHCPFVKHLKKSIVKLANFYMKKGLAVVAISSNSVATHPQDGPQFMAEDAKLFKYPFPYLYDESQDVARDFGAVCTPEFFLFKKLKLLLLNRMDGGHLNWCTMASLMIQDLVIVCL
ncbi:unnamed protein product [Malus baccata var. baccata]